MVFLNIHTATNVTDVCVMFTGSKHFAETGKIRKKAVAQRFSIPAFTYPGERNVFVAVIHGMRTGVQYIFQVFYNEKCRGDVVTSRFYQNIPKTLT